MSFMRRLLGLEKEEADQPNLESPTTEVDPPPSATEESDAEAGQTTPKAPESELDPASLWHDPVGTTAETRKRVSGKPEEMQRPVEPQTPGLRVGYASDVGQLRDHNEDSLVAFQGVYLGDEGPGAFGFFVVADGMGGHRAGEVASTLAARQVTHQVLNRVYLPFLVNETPGADMDPLTDILRKAVERANNRVHEQAPGGGTTLTCALIMDRRAYIAHVGDSRAYLLIDRDMRRLTQDHTYVNRLIELGELSPEEAAVHPQRHVLYRAVGQGDSLDIDTYQQPLPPHSRLLLCSDGLSGQVPEREIGKIIASAPTPQIACQRLIEAANHAGGPDNITAVLIETPPD